MSGFCVPPQSALFNVRLDTYDLTVSDLSLRSVMAQVAKALDLSIVAGQADILWPEQKWWYSFQAEKCLFQVELAFESSIKLPIW